MRPLLLALLIASPAAGNDHSQTFSTLVEAAMTSRRCRVQRPSREEWRCSIALDSEDSREQLHLMVAGRVQGEEFSSGLVYLMRVSRLRRVGRFHHYEAAGKPAWESDAVTVTLAADGTSRWRRSSVRIITPDAARVSPSRSFLASAADGGEDLGYLQASGTEGTPADPALVSSLSAEALTRLHASKPASTDDEDEEPDAD